MSTVKATHFEHPSASTAGITLAADGSVVLPQGFAGGLGTNVVQTVFDGTFSTSSTSYTDLTGLSVAITPTSASSKVLVLVSFNYSLTLPSSNWQKIETTLLRDATRINDGITSGSVNGSTFGSGSGGAWVPADSQANVSFFYVDSPATTSATTYKLQIRTGQGTGSGNAVFINRANNETNSSRYSRSVSSITAIEVAA